MGLTRAEADERTQFYRARILLYKSAGYPYQKAAELARRDLDFAYRKHREFCPFGAGGASLVRFGYN